MVYFPSLSSILRPRASISNIALDSRPDSKDELLRLTNNAQIPSDGSMERKIADYTYNSNVPKKNVADSIGSILEVAKKPLDQRLADDPALGNQKIYLINRHPQLISRILETQGPPQTVKKIDINLLNRFVGIATDVSPKAKSSEEIQTESVEEAPFVDAQGLSEPPVAIPVNDDKISFKGFFGLLKNLFPSRNKQKTKKDLPNPCVFGYLESSVFKCKDEDLTKIMVYKNTEKMVASEPLSFSFTSSNWLTHYQIGAAWSIQETIRREIARESIFLGNGTGSLIAAWLALGIEVICLRDAFEEVAISAGKSWLHSLVPIETVLVKLLEKWIPEDISTLGNRLIISLVERHSGNIQTINEFKDKADLCNHILASCTVNPFSKHCVKLCDGTVLFGGFTKTAPPVFSKTTITISPYKNVGGINPCHYDDDKQYTNEMEMAPSSDPAHYRKQCNRGYVDAFYFFKSKTESCFLSTNLLDSIDSICPRLPCK
jgi:hypothetical protein